MNHYETLGIKKDANQDEIKEAYKALVKRYHPDVYPGDKTFAEKKIKQINVAYDVLSNPEQKKEYDESLNPTPTYTYTPPTYNTNYSPYSYNNYAKNHKTNQSYYDYEQRRYTDYHRSKTPNSNYSNTNSAHDNFSNNIVNSFDKMAVKSKLLILLIVFLFYIIILAVSIFQTSLIFNAGKNEATTNTSKKRPSTSITNTRKTESSSSTSTVEEEFDIYDYFSDEEIYKVYIDYGYDSICTYDEFKELISSLVQSEYSNYYNE